MGRSAVGLPFGGAGVEGLFGVRDGPLVMGMLNEVAQWSFAARQASGGVVEVVWILQSMERAVGELGGQLASLLPQMGAPLGSGAQAQGLEGDPPPADPIIVARAEAPRNGAEVERLLEQLDVHLGAAVQTG